MMQHRIEIEQYFEQSLFFLLNSPKQSGMSMESFLIKLSLRIWSNCFISIIIPYISLFFFHI